jgi:hypothetical protein
VKGKEADPRAAMAVRIIEKNFFLKYIAVALAYSQ